MQTAQHVASQPLLLPTTTDNTHFLDFTLHTDTFHPPRGDPTAGPWRHPYPWRHPWRCHTHHTHPRDRPTARHARRTACDPACCTAADTWRRTARRSAGRTAASSDPASRHPASAWSGAAAPSECAALSVEVVGSAAQGVCARVTSTRRSLRWCAYVKAGSPHSHLLQAGPGTQACDVHMILCSHRKLIG